MINTIRLTVAKEAPRDTLSGLLNWVCPACGGSMNEFKCFGECGRDWHREWEAAKGQLKTPKKIRQ
jgi:hypothetical protein